jgi:hypothetical protein
LCWDFGCTITEAFKNNAIFVSGRPTLRVSVNSFPIARGNFNGAEVLCGTSPEWLSSEMTKKSRLNQMMLGQSEQSQFRIVCLSSCNGRAGDPFDIRTIAKADGGKSPKSPTWVKITRALVGITAKRCPAGRGDS